MVEVRQKYAHPYYWAPFILVGWPFVYRILLTRNDMVFPIYSNPDFNEGDIWSRTRRS